MRPRHAGAPPQSLIRSSDYVKDMSVLPATDRFGYGKQCGQTDHSRDRVTPSR